MKSDNKIFEKRMLGRYELIRKIATGGMAEVFLAKSSGAEGIEKLLVIKKILPDLAQDPRFMTMFVDEARTAMSLNHPNIVQTYDFGHEAGDYFIAMEFVEGNDLATILSLLPLGVRVPLGEALYIVIEICRGLDYAHRRKDIYGVPLNIVHCDISPHNVMVGSEGIIQIVDFGVSRAVRNTSSNKLNTAMGKYQYMSPEQALNSEVDERADIFSTAALLYELLANEPLYNFPNYAEVLNAARSGTLPDFDKIKPVIPQELKNILFKGLDRLATRRYQTIREMQLDLHMILKTVPGIHDALTLRTFLDQNIGTPNYANLSNILPIAEPSPLNQRITIPSSYTPEFKAKKKSAEWDDLGVDDLFAWMDVEDIDLLSLEEQSKASAYIVNKMAFIVAGKLKNLLASYDESSTLSESGIRRLHVALDHLSYKNNAWIQSFDGESFVIVVGAFIMSVGDAQRAVMLAHDIIDAVNSIYADNENPKQFSISITQGLVQLRQDNSQHRRASLNPDDRTVALNIASLANAAEILVSGRAHFHILHAYDLELALNANFDDTQISIYRLLEPKSPKQSQHSTLSNFNKLIGRELQLKEIHDAMMRAQLLGKSQIIMLEGIPGVGKSVIIEEFLRSLNEEHRQNEGKPSNFIIFRVVGLLRTQTIPYSTLRSMFLELLDVDTLESPQMVIINALKQFSLNFSHVEKEKLLKMQLLLEQLLLDYPDEGAYTAIEARQNALQFAALFMDFVPKEILLIFYIDDMHYVDISTIDFFTKLIQQSSRPLLFLVTSTNLESTSPTATDCLEDSFLSFNSSVKNSHSHASFISVGQGNRDTPILLEQDVWKNFLALPNIHRETIHPISDFEAQALLKEQLSNFPISDSASDEIISRSAGNPFFIVEIVQALREREMLTIVEGQYVLAPDAFEKWAPPFVTSVVGEAIDRLPEHLRNNLRLLSILGREFTLADATFLYGANIVDHVRELLRRRWLKTNTSHADNNRIVYIFAQQFAFDLLEQSNDNEDYIHLHKKLADYYAKERESGREISNSAIAHHYEKAKDLVRALEFYRRSAAYLRKTIVPIEATRVCQKALKLIDKIENPPVDTVFEILNIQDWAFLETGQYSKHEETFQKIQKLAIESKNPKLLAQATLSMSSNYFFLGNYEQSRNILKKLIQQIRTNHDYLPELSKAFHFYCNTLAFQGKADECLAIIDQEIEAFPLKENPKNFPELASLYKTKAESLIYLSEFENAKQCLQKAREIDPSLDLKQQILIFEVICNIELGKFYLVPLVEIHKACNPESAVTLRKQAYLLPLLAFYYLRIGDYKQAEDLLSRAIKASRQFKLIQTEAISWMLSLRALVERKNFKKAVKFISIAEKIIEKADNIYISAVLKIVKAEIALFDKKNFYSPENALKHAMAAVSIGQNTSYPLPFIRGYHLATLAYLALEQRENAVKMAKSLAPHLLRHRTELSEIMLYSQAQMLLKIDPNSTALAKQLLEEAYKIVTETLKNIPNHDEREFYLARNTIERIIASH